MSILHAHLRICSVIVILLFGGVVCGQEAGKPLTLLDVLDADGDGELSAREITRSAPLIRRLDVNKDGRVTGDELNSSDGRDDSDSDSDSRERSDRDDDSRADSARSGRDSRGDAASSGRASRVAKTGIDAAISRAATFYKQKKFEDAGKQIVRAQELIEQLIDDDDIETLDEITDSLKRFDRAHELLGKQGVDLPDALDLSEFGVGEKKPEARTSSARPRSTDTADATTPGTVSFTKQIAPILVQNCGGCHVKDDKGELSMESYSSLMAGSAGGEIVKAGNADSSFLVDMVEAGDMPPEGDPLTDEQLQLIRTWIDEGAVFDGDDEEATLSSK